MTPATPVRIARCLLALALPLPGAPVAADATCTDLPWAAEAAAGRLEAIPAGVGSALEEGGRVRSLRIERAQIFDPADPAQDRLLFRVATTCT